MKFKLWGLVKVWIDLGVYCFMQFMFSSDLLNFGLVCVFRKIWVVCFGLLDL